LTDCDCPVDTKHIKWSLRRLIRLAISVVLIGMLAGMSGCGGSGVTAQSGKTEASGQPMETPISPGSTPEGASPPRSGSDPAAGITDPLHRALVGTAWRAGEHHLRFLDGNRVRVQSPSLEPYAPGGLVTRYHLRDGTVTMNVMGHEIRLEWDGQQLRAEGIPAERDNSHP